MKKQVRTVKTTSAEPYLVYGLSFKTIHDDSKHFDDHTIWFDQDEELRDKVYGDWEKGLYWDNVKGEELEFRTPTPNYEHSLTKRISKFSTESTKEIISYNITEEEKEAIISLIRLSLGTFGLTTKTHEILEQIYKNK